MRPPEVVVLYVEVLLAFPSAICSSVISPPGLPVVCDDASVCVELVGRRCPRSCRPPPSAGPRGGNAYPSMNAVNGKLLASLEVYLHGFHSRRLSNSPAVGICS